MDGDENVTLTLMVILSAVSFLSEPVRKVDMRIFVALIVLAAVTVFHSVYVVCLSSVRNAFIGICAMRAIAEHYDMNMRKTGLILLAGFVLNYVFIGLQMLGKDLIYWPAFMEVAGVSGRPWILGCAVAISAPFVVAMNSLFFAAVIPLLWFSKSSVCFAVGSMACLYVMSKRSFWIGAAASCIAFPIYLMGENFDHNRIEVWTRGYAHFQDKFLGRGLGTWAHSAFIHQGGPGQEWVPWVWAHNEFYQQFFEQGAVGLILMVAAAAFVLLCSKGKAAKASMCAIIALSMVHPILHFGKLTLLAVFVMAICLAQGKNNVSRI